MNFDEDEIEPLEEEYCRYNPPQITPSNAQEVEQITSMHFDRNAQLKDPPPDLFARSDGSSGPRLKQQFQKPFEHSASSSFFMYIPIAFWKVVAHATNVKANKKQAQIELEEIMKFFGILFYMTLVDKGEYTNYWGRQVEGFVLGGDAFATDLSHVMSLKRFQFIRSNLSFRHDVSECDMKKDPAARIRPLLQLLKIRCPAFVEPSRNVAIDESSVACRSKFARHLIMYNPSKPTGKYHFKIYVCCCSESWVANAFKLHCRSDLSSRLQGVMEDAEIQELQEENLGISEMRQLVSELITPIVGTGRIVNTDNYYTSTQLLLLLKSKGLYGRGTVRTNSKHFPRVLVLAKDANTTRGDMLQAVSVEHQMVAASWIDGNVVNIVSNADASTKSPVWRQVKRTKVM